MLEKIIEGGREREREGGREGGGRGEEDFKNRLCILRGD